VPHRLRHAPLAGVALVLALALVPAWLAGPRPARGQERAPRGPEARGEPAPEAADREAGLSRPTAEEAARKSAGCVTCHRDVPDIHGKETGRLGCVDCHGGDATCTDKDGAHVAPRFPDAWPTSGNPVRSYTLLNHETPEFVRFVNPGDLRVAHLSCG